VCCFVLTAVSHGYANVVEGSEGFVDASNLDLAGDSIVNISGSWAFFPREFIDPLSTQRAGQFLDAGEVWDSGSGLSQDGYGSYRMVVTLPESSEEYSLNISPRYIAYNLYINGRLIAQNGTVGQTAAQSQLEYRHQVIDLGTLDTLIGNRLIVVFHVANFEFPETSLASGRSIGLQLGSTEDVQALVSLDSSNRFISLGIYATLGIFCIGMSLFNQAKKDMLLFGGFCLLFLIEVFVSVENSIGLLSVASWPLNLRINQIIGTAIAVAGFLYLRELFPHEYPKPILRIVTILGGFLIVAGLALPLGVALPIMRVNAPFFLAALLYFCIAAFVSLIRKRDNAKLLFFGIVATATITILASAVSVLLPFTDGFINRYGRLLSQYAFFVFLFSQALLLSKRTAKLETDLLERTLSLEVASAQIVELNKRLHAENTRMERELETTRRLQDMLLPKQAELTAFDHVSIAATMQPASEVGGDYYDVLTRNTSTYEDNIPNQMPNQHIGDQHVTIGIGDVTGHGLESGMIMLMTQMGIKTLLEAGISDIETILTTLNRSLYANVARMGAERSLTLGLLDYYYQPPAPSDHQPQQDIIRHASAVGQGHLRFCGQHETLIVFRANGTVEEHDTIDLGFPIALEEDVGQWVNSLHLTLQVGDGVVLYTDGITEAENDCHQIYGSQRLINCIKRSWHKSTEQIKWAVIADLEHFVGNKAIYDDVTLVILKQM
jgi:serine phosphatase RsbU (regulator of sigma subunit)